MRIEGDSVVYVGADEYKIEEIDIRPGDVHIIDNNKIIEAMSILDIDSKVGSLRVNNPEGVDGRLFFDEDDKEGVELDLSKEVVMYQGHEVLLYKPTEEGDGEIWLYFNADPDNFDEEPSLKKEITLRI